MMQFLAPLLTTVIGGLIQGATSSADRKAQEEADKKARLGKKGATFQAPEPMRASGPASQIDTGSRLAPQDPMVRSQAMEMLRARMNQGA